MSVNGLCIELVRSALACSAADVGLTEKVALVSSNKHCRCAALWKLKHTY